MADQPLRPMVPPATGVFYGVIAPFSRRLGNLGVGVVLALWIAGRVDEGLDVAL